MDETVSALLPNSFFSFMFTETINLICKKKKKVTKTTLIRQIFSIFSIQDCHNCIKQFLELNGAQLTALFHEVLRQLPSLPHILYLNPGLFYRVFREPHQIHTIRPTVKHDVTLSKSIVFRILEFFLSCINPWLEVYIWAKATEASLAVASVKSWLIFFVN